VFGKNSIELSNCYFLLGCYFAEEGYFKKAIACFMKAGIGRGQLAGDCYYNVGILSAMQGDRCRALEMFELSKPLRLGQHGEGKDPIAEVLENQGMTYAERNDYFTAYESFD
jgi:tetratricopeptide (TPR) repeat protein